VSQFICCLPSYNSRIAILCFVGLVKSIVLVGRHPNWCFDWMESTTSKCSSNVLNMFLDWTLVRLLHARLASLRFLNLFNQKPDLAVILHCCQRFVNLISTNLALSVCISLKGLSIFWLVLIYVLYCWFQHSPLWQHFGLVLTQALFWFINWSFLPAVGALKMQFSVF